MHTTLNLFLLQNECGRIDIKFQNSRFPRFFACFSQL